MFWRWWRKTTTSYGPTIYFAPSATEIDKFVVLLFASGLMRFSELREACADFDTDRDDENALDDLCNRLVAKGLLTQWQCDKLRDGKWKGFYLDNYRLLSHLTKSEMTTTLLAEDVSTGKRVALAVRPIHAAPWFQYSVVEEFDN